ncbi:3',5'-bisphosphate nucleotidase [Stereum hirsutum FP-91666 SS1]|uniref:3',5'-bisphosphate nucleotidase n=1 Tax=Stereum hirsutum (strain FP-91666) TaxID=721885 RepID=UPI000444A361|nr:3',5'-bisphosphate nucleotidase [Stereum hirsutum FP-91666 SS1]EIM84996.1 3',5'-bisphosphate nucleotidase [Stereum hirsutum FP-91666 SS1]
MSLDLATEQQVALAAVRRACTVTSLVFNNLVKGETLVKGDKSPVTVGDFSAQAVVNTVLQQAFPNDPVIGEEDADDLRSNPELRSRVVELANEVLSQPLGYGEMKEWGLGEERTEEQLLEAIDRGNYEGGRTGRMWTLDPIDGTKGFLRGGQYAVCLSLIIDSVVHLGIIGCPNLPSSPSSTDRGCIFLATLGQGAHQLTLSGGSPTPLKMPILDIKDVRLLESVEKEHAALGFNDIVAKVLGVEKEPMRMDSQAKYGALARGDGGVYLRMPTGVGYREKIWDHAAGALLVEEAGGIVSDSRGQPLDFGLGRTLGENFGVVAAEKSLHSKVLEAIKEAKEAEAEGGKL